MTLSSDFLSHWVTFPGLWRYFHDLLGLAPPCEIRPPRLELSLLLSLPPFLLSTVPSIDGCKFRWPFCQQAGPYVGWQPVHSTDSTLAVARA